MFAMLSALLTGLFLLIAEKVYDHYKNKRK